MRAEPAGEALAVVAGVVLVIVLVGSGPIRDGLDQDVVRQVLTSTAAAIAAAVALLGAFAARLTESQRWRWIAAALVLYAVLVLPSTVLDVAPDADLALRSLRLAAYCATLVMLVASIRPPARIGAVGIWMVAVAGAVSAFVAGATADLVPAPIRAVIEGPIAAGSVLGGWSAVAIAVLIDGIRRRSGPRRLVGLGFLVLAGAQLHRVTTSMPSAPVDLMFAALRLLGLAVVVVGLSRLVMRTVVELRSEQFAQQEELALAALHTARASELAAERDHELRNGLAGLSGITHLLSAPGGDVEHDRLRHAVLAELGRLHVLLDGGGSPGPTDPPEGYPVAPVLDGLVALRRSSGADVTMQVTPGLRAGGDSAVLAQVITNLLANCDRHAPGAALTLSAHAESEHAVVQVRDTGPGLPPGREDAVLRPGVRDASAGGSGLGLSISRRLVEREGGTLAVTTVSAPRGCLATVRVPLADD